MLLQFPPSPQRFGNDHADEGPSHSYYGFDPQERLGSLCFPLVAWYKGGNTWRVTIDVQVIDEKGAVFCPYRHADRVEVKFYKFAWIGNRRVSNIAQIYFLPTMEHVNRYCRQNSRDLVSVVCWVELQFSPQTRQEMDVAIQPLDVGIAHIVAANGRYIPQVESQKMSNGGIS